jgi:tetratricopeptide (TPR) repeat protein
MNQAGAAPENGTFSSLGEALIYAERCRTEGRLMEAESVCRKIIEARPNSPEAEHLLGIIAHQSGKIGEAIEHIQQAVKLAPQVAIYHANLGEMCRLAGRVDDAIAAGRRALALNPNYAGALSNLGIALFDQGNFEEALALYDRAVALDPSFAQAHSNRGNALQRLKRFAEAEPSYRRALELQPSFADALNNLGTCLRELKRSEEAEAVYRKAIELMPNDPDTLDNLALALKDLDRLDEAAELLCRALLVEQRVDKFHAHYGAILLDQKKIEDAAAAAERALALNPDNPDAVNLMGRVASERGNPAASLSNYKRALELKPDLADAHNNMGNALKELGQLGEAREAYLEALRLDPAIPGVYVNLADSKKFVPGDPHLVAMEKLAAKPENLSKIDRMQLDFGLGKAYADVEDFPRALKHLLAGNAAKRAAIAYDEKSTFALFDRIETAFSEALMKAEAGRGDPSAMPIFIIGMPRSGTTLTEQIIASHPLVHGAGELQTLNDVILAVRGPHGDILAYPEFIPALDARALQQIGAQYVALVRALAVKHRGADAKFVTDKMPSNYYFAGLIHLALPNAKIIHTVRDPVDTCISCYSRLFSAQQNHTYDLAELGRYYRRYEHLMAHWRRVLPPGRMLDVRYEEVVADLEKQARRIIAHCGLPWDDRCLSFYETERPVRTASATQVRQPIYKDAVGRWRAYQQYLGPLLGALGIAAK